ncbi:MAG: protein-L-isoD(D-D) O-methyltransferase [Archangium sp.]
MKAPLAVTVTAKQPGRYVVRAREKAAEWGVPFFEREKKSAVELLFENAEALLVLGGDGWTLTDPLGELRCTPGMAAVRIKRLQRDPDAADDGLLRFAELQPGDSVFDGTLGLGTDALVCAYRVGPSGRVIGCEASLPLFALVSEGLRGKIDVRRGRTIELLKTFESSSIDVITLDPMFDVPRASSPAFEILRRYAVHEPLELETLNEARRVAKRWVIVKAGRFGKELARLGLKAERDIRRSSPLLWARAAPSK